MPEYDFRTLSPTDFEYLIGDVLNADLDLRLHSYPEGRDQGIDLRQVTADGHTTIVQCKHYRKSSPSTFLTAVRKEAHKPALRMADRYLFVTSQDLSAQREDEVARILGIPHEDVWGPRAINDALGRHPEVERLHFKLWLSSTAALEAILHAGRWRRTDALLADVAERAKYWVETPAYAAVRDILESEGVCLVAGIPGVGKTFLADMIMLGAVEEGWQVVDLSGDGTGGVADGWAAAQPQTRQLFYYDDFLGEAELELTAAAAPGLLRFISYVRRNAADKRLILTSREHVLRQASVAISDRLRQLVGDPARYTIALTAYDSAVRAEILANHLHFSDLPDEERERLTVDNRMMAIARHPSYNPRLFEAVITTRSLAHATADQVLEEILAALHNPERVWAVSFDALDPLAQDIVLTLATHPARPVPLEEIKELSAPSGTRARAWRAAVKSLEPTWIKVTDDRAVVFANPGCRDFLLGRLDDPDLAEEWVGRLRRLRQLLSVSRSAGLLTAEPGVPRSTVRPHLTLALTARRAGLARLVGQNVADELRPDAPLPEAVRTLRDAAALLSVYGTTETSGWIVDRVAELARPSQVPAADGFALATWLSRVPTATPAARAELVQTLITSALGGARTSRDLDAYEALPDELRTTAVHEIARLRAMAVIDAELDRLTADCADPDVLRESAHDLAQRAQWYGHEVHINALLDRADELAAGLDGPPVAADTNADHAPEELRQIFSRLTDD
ncbi:MAG TPA: restriction endonuclease [Streptosporangiaceae bacterium]|jgi:hypothetical protein